MPAHSVPDDIRPAETIATSVAAAAETLIAAGIADARVDAELLLAHVLGASRGELQAAALRGDAMDATSDAHYRELVARRAAREPLQHITGSAPFRHLELRVGPGVFVPRPETETLVQIALDALLAAASPSPIAIDLGTGSGAIALALATEAPHARIFAAENAVDAFVWAKENFAQVGAQNATLAFIDLAHAFPDLDGTASVVVSNPPYVPDAAVPRDPEVRWFDPPSALYGGEDGLDVVRQVSATALRLAHPGALVAIEHGESQGAAIRELLVADGWRAPATHMDLTRRDRVTTALHP
ncbi:peptide chain release factor N(5)-glutamine methyltransferase [Microbacterium sp. NPDC076895]|jgi:release factor glutamine methyltransferase|uniref:peptide chain release factor N(5)-glutamine methyltransferase n=1 Tax=Microbacterium sp. NPDC076895 TaxID=3154957 RepID=UPI0034495FEF